MYDRPHLISQNSFSLSQEKNMIITTFNLGQVLDNKIQKIILITAGDNPIKHS